MLLSLVDDYKGDTEGGVVCSDKIKVFYNLYFVKTSKYNL